MAAGSGEDKRPESDGAGVWSGYLKPLAFGVLIGVGVCFSVGGIGYLIGRHETPPTALNLAEGLPALVAKDSPAHPRIVQVQRPTEADGAIETRKGGSAESSCDFIADQADAEALLKRLLPKMKVIDATSEYPLDAGVCLREVELFADAAQPASRGFVYVLPDGQHFLNGPLMDKRSKIGVEAMDDVQAALQAQREQLQANGLLPKQDSAVPTPPRQQQSDNTRIVPRQPLAQTSPPPAAAPTTTAPVDQREQLITDMEQLPAITEKAPGKQVNVLLDPNCPRCRELYAKRETLAQAYGIRFNWIPLYTREETWPIVALILKAQQSDPAQAAVLLDQAMTGKLAGIDHAEALKALTPDDYARAKKALLLYHQVSSSNPGLGTPLVTFRKPDTKVEVIAGLPIGEDWDQLGSTSVLPKIVQ